MEQGVGRQNSLPPKVMKQERVAARPVSWNPFHRRQRFPRCARGRPPASSSRRPVPQLWLKPGLLPSQPGPGLPWALHSCYSRQPPAPGTPGKDLPCPFIFVQLSNAKSCCPKGSSGGHLGLFSRLALLCVPCRLL